MKSEATTVRAYLAALDPERRAAMTIVREAIRTRLPRGYEEAMNWGMICYQVPLSVCPETYNGQPLMYAALASQKNHMAVYLSGVYLDARLQREFESRYRASGKRMDIGRSCVRFRRLEDLPIDLIADSVAAMPMAEFVARVSEVHSAGSVRRAR